MGYSAFQVARALAEESRSHQPLPDTVHDPLFCALQARREKYAGLALPSPQRSLKEEDGPVTRPTSSILPTRKITEMDLAIRWELRLPGEKRSVVPKPLIAPSVFNVVPPADNTSEECTSPPLRREIPPRPPTPPPPPVKPKNAWSEANIDQIHHRKNEVPNEKHKPEKSERRTTAVHHNENKRSGSIPIRSRSTPNLNRRPCEACDHDKPGTAATNQSNNFKQAFKAGRPNNTRPTTSLPKQRLQVPKPRKPFTKRSYSIATLAPPFSLWPDGSRAQDYPDHWRLASVYQHSYKTPQIRRKPLLTTVFQ